MLQVEYMGPTASLDLKYKVDPGTLDLVRGLIWMWILENGDRRVSIKIWIISKSYKLSELHKLFEIVLGPKPITASV